MKISAGNKFHVELEQIPKLGAPWIVRVYRRFFIFKKRISSDWFLDGEQAKTFAERLAKELSDHGSIATLKERKPGWTLHRDSR